MALRHERSGGIERVVDIGASYLTVSEPGFATVVDDWRRRGLAREWTDTFVVRPAARGAGGAGGAGDAGGAGGAGRSVSGPMRWAAAGGLRSLVVDLAAGLDVGCAHEVDQVDADRSGLAVDGQAASAVVLAMPQPQAADLLPPVLIDRLGLEPALDWSAALTVWAGWQHRWWPGLDAAFVEGSDVVERIIDDGRRRGDEAPVLVAHSTPELARLLQPPGARMPEPEFARVHRWSLAAPAAPQPRPFALDDRVAVGVCGDGWGPRPRVEQAWLSGDALGRALARRLA